MGAKVLLWLAGVGAVLFVVLLMTYRRSSAALEREKLTEVQELTTDAAAAIAERTRRAELAATFIARHLSAEPPPDGFDVTSIADCAPAPTELDRAWAERCLEALLRDNPDLYGASITDRPAPNPHSIYVYKSESGECVRGEIPDKYATTQEASYLWYREPMQSGRDGWSPPYYDDAGQVLMTTYSALFYAPADGGERVPAGVVTVDVSGERIRQLVQHLNLGPSGYGALTARDGTYLYHPNVEYLQTRKTILDVAQQKGDDDRVTMWAAIERGESGTIEHRSTTTGEDSWLIYARVGDSGWSLQNTFVKNDIAFDVDLLRRRLLESTATAVGVLLLLLGYALTRRDYPVRREWLLSTGAAVLLIVAIGATWALALRYPPTDATQRSAPSVRGTEGCDDLPRLLGEGGLRTRRVAESAVLQQVEQDYAMRAACQLSLNPVFVQLGTKLEVFRFLGSNEIEVAGEVWTRVPAFAPRELRGEVSLVSATNESFRELDSRTLSNGDRLTRWRFEATLAQSRNSTRYPIERESVRLTFGAPRTVFPHSAKATKYPIADRLSAPREPVAARELGESDEPLAAHTGLLGEGDEPRVVAGELLGEGGKPLPPSGTLDDNGEPQAVSAPSVPTNGRGYRVYLVPALGDYEVTTPSAKPGLLPSLVIAGWRAKSTYFELSAPPRGAAAGLGTSAAELVPPVLAFTVVVERDFADAFISNLTPIIVVALMLFAVLLVSARLDYGRALSICMGMFFVIVFSHIDLRQRLAVQEVFYLEYFYFTLYAGILWVSFNCLLQGFKTKIPLIEARDRLLVMTTYWPALLGTLYVFTLWTFY